MFNQKGSLKDMSVMKLLLTVFEEGLTGILYIKRQDILKVLYFTRGKLIWAISNSDVDKLEHILAAKKLVPKETINEVKKQGRVSDSIGKLLVEKGLITLEELIESSKIQLRRIINSVFKWKEGGYQFVKEAPPERLLSLDLDITQFVIDYIVDEVDVSDILKEIGSLQVGLLKNPDEQKVERYPLSDKQTELLNSFDGKQKLETILSKHSTGHRDSLLKIIYFFFMAELLLKKESVLSVLSNFDVEKSIDDLEDTANESQMVISDADNISMEPLEPLETIEPIEPPVPGESIESIEPGEPIESMEPPEPGKPIEPIEDFEPIVDISELEAIEAIKPTRSTKYIESSEPIKPIEPGEPIKPIEPIEPIQFSEPGEPSEPSEPIEPIEPGEPGEPGELGEPGEPGEPIESRELTDRGKTEESLTGQDDSYIHAAEPEKSIGETFEDELEELESPAPRYDKQAAAPTTSFSKIKEEKKRLKFFNIIMILIFLILVIGGIILLLIPMMESTDPAKNVVEKAEKGSTEDIIKIEEKIPGKTETDEPGEKTGEKKPGITGKDQTPPTTSPIPGKTAKAYFLEGSFITAGDVWKRGLIKKGVKYGILLELDCLKESVLNAYNKLPSKKDFYILNRRVGSKTCFLVMWGKFFAHEQAAEAIKSTSIPSYFWQQKDPPSIVELSKYL